MISAFVNIFIGILLFIAILNSNRTHGEENVLGDCIKIIKSLLFNSFITLFCLSVELLSKTSINTLPNKFNLAENVQRSLAFHFPNNRSCFNSYFFAKLLTDQLF